MSERRKPEGNKSGNLIAAGFPVRREILRRCGNGKAIRYKIGVGREGFTWAGRERISRMAEWPDWRPPGCLIGTHTSALHPGGLTNPLNARALYLGDTLYRIPCDQPAVIHRNV